MTDMFDISGGRLPDDLRALDEELSALRYEERPSFVPELRAELARVWAGESIRTGSTLRRHLAAAALAAVFLGSASVPAARASFVRLIGAFTPEPEAAQVQSPVQPLPPGPEAAAAPEADVDEPEVIAAPSVSVEATGDVAAPVMMVPSPPIVPEMLDREAAEAMLQAAYPESLQRRGIGGIVRVRMWVDDTGRASDASVSESSGVGELDRIARLVAPSFRFMPGLQEGRPVGTWIEFPVLFEPDPERVDRVLGPVVDPMSLPTVDRSEWWHLSEPLDLATLARSPRTDRIEANELAIAERGLVAALEDPSVVETFGPAVAILRGVAPESVTPTEWRAAVGAALDDAIARGAETPASLLALGRIRLRQGVRTEARGLFERGLQIALSGPDATGAWVVGELHYERGRLVQDNWRASTGVGRVRSEAFSAASCAAARSSGGAGTGFASVERLIAWNYLCPGELGDVFAAGFEPHEGRASADLTLMMASYRAAIEAYPGHVGANTDFLVTLAGDGRWEDVLRGALRFTRVSDGHPNGLLLAGIALQRLERSTEAAEHFEAALERMDPALADRLADVGFLLRVEDRYRYRSLPALERRAWEVDFWARKDRNARTEVNERRVEHLSRTAYAHLALGGVYGDAGEVWVRFGGPKHVHVVDGGSGRLTEFWDYGSGPDITFVRWASGAEADLTPEGRAYVDDLGRVFSPE